MTVFLCPPPSARRLDPAWTVPHPGFGVTILFKNGRAIWCDADGTICDSLTIAALTEQCHVRRGVGFSLEIDGPFVREIYRLRSGSWVLTEQHRGFV